MRVRYVFWVIVLITFVSFSASLDRYWEILEYPTGYGRTATSPDGLFEASAMTVTDKYFFGGERRYYEFAVRKAHGDIIRRAVVDTLKMNIVEWRDSGTIEWAGDSRAVTFACESVKVTLER